MKKWFAVVLAALILSGCGSRTESVTEVTAAGSAEVSAEVVSPGKDTSGSSRFDSRTEILLSDGGITVNGGDVSESVYTSRDIVYYEKRDAYDSGYPYGEGTEYDWHPAEEAEGHLVVNITAPGAYVVSGTLSAGQIRVDLGENACEDPEAVVELILSDAEISCTVAPAILFLNTYECDKNRSAEEAKPEIDTSAAGANLILEGENKVTGSYVARIYQDMEGMKNLWKQDGAIYSYMSLNVFGPGSLELIAENEGLDTEQHLTIHGGNIVIRSQNDGINANRDYVSVITVKGGSLEILAGLGTEGDGLDSNGFIVIHDGLVITSAHPMEDAGMDGDYGLYIHGGRIFSIGYEPDLVTAGSEQAVMNLRFAAPQGVEKPVVVADENGGVRFAFDPEESQILRNQERNCVYMVLSGPDLAQGEEYQLFLGGKVQGQAEKGMYHLADAYTEGTRLLPNSEGGGDLFRMEEKVTAFTGVRNMEE